jgi:replication fork clamp-binding protein CrfC
MICHHPADSWKHSLIDCLMARSLWALIDHELDEHLTAHNTSDAKQWIFHLIELEDFVKVLVVLWAIWTARRKVIYEEIFQSPLSIFSFLTNYLHELLLATPMIEKEGNSSPMQQVQ